MKENMFEFLGTFFLVLTIALTGDPVAIGVALTCLVYAGGSVSGAHYNPAVSFAMFLQKKITVQVFKQYIFFQSAGATLATVVSRLVFQKTLFVTPKSDIPWITAQTAEFLFTFLLITVILHVAATKKTQGNNYFGIAIGGSVFAGATAVGALSGGAFNPAVGLAPLVINFLLGLQPFDPSLFFLYTIGPALGAFAAASFYGYTQK